MCVGKNRNCTCCRNSIYIYGSLVTCKEHVLDEDRPNKKCLGITTTNLPYICSNCKNHTQICVNKTFDTYFFEHWP